MNDNLSIWLRNLILVNTPYYSKYKISIVKFINKYPRMKKSLLFLDFLKSSFKITKEICHENTREFKQM